MSPEPSRKCPYNDILHVRTYDEDRVSYRPSAHVTTPHMRIDPRDVCQSQSVILQPPWTTPIKFWNLSCRGNLPWPLQGKILFREVSLLGSLLIYKCVLFTFEFEAFEYWISETFSFSAYWFCFILLPTGWFSILFSSWLSTFSTKVSFADQIFSIKRRYRFPTEFPCQGWVYKCPWIGYFYL